MYFILMFLAVIPAASLIYMLVFAVQIEYRDWKDKK
ncbi:MAG: hypothetical protein ACFWTP_13800 [Enterococcus gilvus]|jgi:hypothetical protein